MRSSQPGCRALIRPETMAALSTPATWGASLALFAMLGLAALVIGRRVKPE